MNLIFTSNIFQNNQPTKVTFETKVNIFQYKEFTVYEFKDPESKLTNRIEVSKTKVNIFIGPSTLNMELNKQLPILYETGNGTITINTFLVNLKFKSNEVKFKYTLADVNNNKIGEYEILLQTKER